MKPEHELLLLSARPSFDKVGAARLRAVLNQDLDWEWIERAAKWHGLIPHVSRALSDSAPKNGSDALQRLALFTKANRIQNSMRSLKLLELLEQLNHDGVEVLVLKGPTLSVLAYGCVEGRQYADLDLLVRPEHLEKTAQALTAGGYSPEAALPYRALSKGNSLPFHHNAGDPDIDLHWRLNQRPFPFGPSDDLAWKRSQQVVINGREVATLGSLDLAHYLCAHAARHGWRLLSMLTDIAAMLERRLFDVNALLWQATHARARRIVLLALFLAHRALEADVEPWIISECREDPILVRTADKIERRFFLLEAPTDVGEILLVSSLIEGRWQRLRYLVDSLFAPGPKDWEFVSLPGGLSLFHVALRPLRVFLSYGSRRLAAFRYATDGRRKASG